MRKGQRHIIEIISARNGQITATILTEDFKKCRIEIDDSKWEAKMRRRKQRAEKLFFDIITGSKNAPPDLPEKIERGNKRLAELERRGPDYAAMNRSRVQ
jgi:hypothetical protein